MKKTVSHRTDAGFTLIELLVVIAIISILTALLFPAIKQALANGQAVRVANDGRQIWTGLYATNLDNEQSGRGSIWPTENDYENSTDFLRDCIANNWLDKTYTFRYMAAPGLVVAAKKDPATFKGDNNAWCVVLGVGDQTQLETPFMFTRNLISATGGSRLTDIDTLDASIKPFGDTIAVVITFGGSVQIIRGKDAEGGLQSLFNPMGEDLSFVSP